MTEEPWKIEVTVLIPRDQAKDLDEAIDIVGERLKPLPWAGRVRAEPE